MKASIYLATYIATFLFGSAARAQDGAVQVIPNYGDSIQKTTWFDSPAPTFRVSWMEPQNLKTLNWGEYRGGKLIDSQRAATPSRFYNWKFSPDASRIAGHFASGDNDNQHDSRTFDFATRRFGFVADNLYGNSEAWAPDGKRIAFLRGTTDYSAGDQKPVRLLVRELSSGREAPLRTDNEMESVRWTSKGDLLVVTSRNRPDDSFYNVTVRFRGGRGKAEILAAPDSSILSPNGQHRLFFAPANSKSPGYVAGLYLTDGTKKQRRLVAPSSTFPGEVHIGWASDSQTAFLVDVTQSGIPKTGTSAVTASLALRFHRVDAKTGDAVLVGELEAAQENAAINPQNFDNPNYSNLSNFQALGFSRDGQWFFFRRSEWKYESPVTIEVQAAALHAVRLRDGKLFPVAVFQGEFALAPLGF